MSKSSIDDKTVAFTSSLLERGVQSSTRSDLIDKAIEEIYDERYGSGDEKFGNFISTADEITIEESDLYPHVSMSFSKKKVLVHISVCPSLFE
ncbi:hypothetical protein HanPSC8_Chr09g0355871 [Helianthus annuus]|nr:hypothetical protein HanPSC8_Chr09g0355871 [Helianthus annuus]